VREFVIDQVSRMPVSRIALGAPGDLSHPDTAKAAVSEFISMLIFVFAGSGSGMAFSKLDLFLTGRSHASGRRNNINDGSNAVTIEIIK
jgi:hypothetical protein